MSWFLELLRLRTILPLAVDSDGRFVASLPNSSRTTEAPRVIGQSGGGPVYYSPYHWIDLFEELARFGRRSYTARTADSLQSFAGAGRLFEELLDFLWRRVDPVALQGSPEEDARVLRRFRGRRQNELEVDENAPLAPAAFITDENLISSLNWRASHYVPYNRSTLSLRDLLSLILLRVAVETTPDEPVEGEETRVDESRTVEKTLEKEEQRRSVVEQLGNYLRQYCKRYATRLLDADFLSSTKPGLRFENHYTVGRVLLEFVEKSEKDRKFTKT